MSTQRSVYEGPDPEQLLLQAWSEHGPSVRISEPEERRHGGIFGFFSKITYRIEVEPVGGATPGQPAVQAVPGQPMPAQPAVQPVPGQPVPGQPAVQPVPGQGMPAQPVPGQAVASQPSAAQPAAVENGATGAAVRAPAHAARNSAAGAETGDALQQLADGTQDVLELSGTPTATFGEVLDGVASSLGEEPGFYQPSLLSQTLSVEEAASGGGRGESAGPSVGGSHVGGIGPEGIGAAAGGAGTAGAGMGSGAGAGGSATTIGSGTPPPDLSTEPAWVGLGSALRGRHDALAAAAAVRRMATVVDLLRNAGFPEALLRPLEHFADAEATLEAAFALLPPPPGAPRVSGSLIAVAGPGQAARDAARRIAGGIGLDESLVALASPWRAARTVEPDLFVQTPEEAGALSPGWRRDRPGVVAVSAPLVSSDHRWARDVLRSMRPSAVWGVVSATVKPEDIVRWSAKLGGLDALVLEDVAHTATPAAVLATGIPVVSLDGRLATPGTWAAVIAALVEPGEERRGGRSGGGT